MTSQQKQERQAKRDKQTLSHIERFRHLSYIVSLYIQYFIAFIITLAIILSFWSLPQQLLLLLDVDSDSLIRFLKYSINMIIALELIRVLCHQTLDTIVEILLMAVTRELIIGHMATWEMLIGVIAIAILFAVRKFLYVSQLDKANRLELEKGKACTEEKAAKAPDTLPAETEKQST